MRKLLLAILTIAFCAAGKAQADKNNLSVAVDFKSIAGLGRMQTSDAFQSYKSGAVTGSQFYTDAWCQGAVTTTANETISNYLLLYDKVRQELFIRPKDTNLVIQADKSQVKNFTLIVNNAPHLFVPSSVYTGLPPGCFFEMLVADTNYTLLKFTRTTFVRADYIDMLKVRNGEVNDAFVDDITYYVYHNNAIIKMALKEHAVRKALSGLSPKVDAFLDAHRNNEFSEQLLINLVTALNQ
ncbi:MAG TPA: hypothetical protein VG738_23970 [Chitinophagaceae bacterium]|nr:hypothetical protein [Chitinophagaceae bacterium]